MKIFTHRIYCCLLIAILSLSLTGCPIPSSNRSTNKNARLPYGPMADKTLVYITQPYTAVDWYFVGGAASDAAKYNGTKIYLKSATDPNYVYIGNSKWANNFCFYIDPGRYHIKFINDGANPTELGKDLDLTANTVRILGLDLTTYSGGINVSAKLNELSIADGKGYVAQNPPQKCVQITAQKLNNTKPLTFSLTLIIHNQTKNWLYYEPENSTDKLNVMEPGGNKTLTETRTISAQDFSQSGIKLEQGTSLYISKNGSAPAYRPSQNGYPSYISGRSITVAASAYFPEEAVSATFQDRDQDCKTEKTTGNTKVTCVANIVPCHSLTCWMP